MELKKISKSKDFYKFKKSYKTKVAAMEVNKADKKTLR